jgi:Zn-dependent metalloprotease
MLRAGRQDGQVGVGYAGVLAILSLVFVGLYSLGIDQRLGRTVEGAVCTILGGSECVRPDGTTTDLGEHTDSGRAEREVYDAECSDDLPGELRRHGDDGPTGDPEADAAWDNLGRTYDYYADTFGRDSYDDSGAELIATINFCEDGEALHNAYWNGEQMVFGEGYANPLDVTAHELTHAITDRTADLVYECQSGALNESFSDIFASNVDTDDWEIGEDLPDGSIRDMADPGRFGDPAHVRDYDTRPNDDDPFNDHGAVHSNSGIPNHAYYLIVQRIGREDAEQVMYRVLTEELEPTSGFEDFRAASLEVARELFGSDSSEYAGIDDSFAAVGLDGTWVAPEVEGC